ncbi:septation ring formation regulator EzrA [Mycoplasma sp. SG1]|uniref:septation ring formation regulator EzrA n=1 Tax=Mycoplasma sp. SG1 TaxID=2810348 RepID=UPI002AFEE0C9|nr:septation ring formation regulator EzrA [Mycoplasma sp. SG1]URM52802.1 hypothetical protein JRW51_00445 [Mycoplasma sp. SG1]
MKILTYIFLGLLIVIFIALIVIIVLLIRYKRAISVLKHLKSQIHIINSLQYRRSLANLKLSTTTKETENIYSNLLNEYNDIKNNIAINIIKDVRKAETLLTKKKINEFFKLAKPLKSKLKILKLKIMKMIEKIDDLTSSNNQYLELLKKYQEYYETIKTYYSNNFLLFEKIDLKIKEFFKIIDDSFIKLDEMNKNNKFAEMTDEFSKLKPAILFISNLFINYPKQHNLVKFIIPKKYSEVEKKYYELIKSGCRLSRLDFVKFCNFYKKTFSTIKRNLENIQYKKVDKDLNKLVSVINQIYKILTREEKYFQNLNSVITTLEILFKKTQNLKIRFNSIFSEKNENYKIEGTELAILDKIEQNWVSIKNKYDKLKNLYQAQSNIDINWTDFYSKILEITNDIKNLNTKLKEGIVYYKKRKTIIDYQNEFIQLKQLIFLINTKRSDKNFELFFKTCPHDIQKIAKDIRSFLVYLGKKPIITDKIVKGIYKLKDNINEIYNSFIQYNEQYKTATRLMMKAVGLRDRNKTISIKLPQLEILYATNQFKEVVYILNKIF